MQPPAGPQDPCPPVSTSRPQRTSSSASSACIGPDEDWTKVSDFVERRRLQSRIAQRTYRMKQKQQMELALRQSVPDPAISESSSDLSGTDSQLPDIPNLFDLPASDVAPQALSSDDDYLLPIESFTPPFSMAEPPAVPPRAASHMSTPGTPACFQQQASQSLFNTLGCHLSPPLHQAFNHDCMGLSQQFPHHCSPPEHLCACSPSVYYPPQPPMYNCYGRVSSGVGHHYPRTAYGQFDPYLPINNLGSAFPFPDSASTTCMALPAQAPTLALNRNSCCCHHHHHHHPPRMSHGGGFDIHTTQAARNSNIG